MISFKKHLDAAFSGPLAPTEVPLSDTLECAYRSAILAIGRTSARTAPNAGEVLQQNLAKLHDGLIGQTSHQGIAEIDRKLVRELDDWGDRTSSYFQQKTTEIKEILILMNHYAQSTGERDDTFATKLKSFSGRLEAIAHLDDLTSIRQTLSQSANELNECVGRMATDRKQVESDLRSELAGYQTRLADAERISLLDVLTSLANRRGIEQQIEERMSQGKPFCVVLFDLNGFKQINDNFGHLAGDQLLQQFAMEVRTRFGAGSPAGRWGGDEFLVILDGDLQQADSTLRNIMEWLFGDYRIKCGKGSIKVTVSASTGLAQWDGKEAIQDLFKRADRNMYQEKKSASR